MILKKKNITLKKYSHTENVESIASMHAESFYQVLKYNVIVTDTDKIVAVGGNLKKKYLDSGISEEMSYELLANGLLACIHQNLVGSPRRLRAEAIFANPNINGGCAVRSMLRSGKISIATLLEQQKTKLEKGLPLFEN